MSPPSFRSLLGRQERIARVVGRSRWPDSAGLSNCDVVVARDLARPREERHDPVLTLQRRPGVGIARADELLLDVADRQDRPAGSSTSGAGRLVIGSSWIAATSLRSASQKWKNAPDMPNEDGVE